MIKTCCEWLKHMLATVGEQGTAVVAVRDGDIRQFYLQARSLTRWQEKAWERLLGAKPLQAELDPLFRNEEGALVAIVTEMRVPIAFCPHCGTNLTRLANRNRDEFDKLAEAHLPFAGT